MAKVVLINGGSRGIGKAMVKLFSARGYPVAFTYKSSEAEAASLSKETGALALRADSASETEVNEAVDKVEKVLGTVDILINNAAVS
jgi:3-oxoacyl-[acyl-carrier protein] reductase